MKRAWMMGVLMLGWAIGGVVQKPEAKEAAGTTAFDFAFEAIDGSPMPLSDYTGKVLLVVNTASECGFTQQYSGLEKLWQAYKEQGLVVIGVPSNDFGGQEPASNAEIQTFCESRFRVTFPMAGKTVVKGDGAHPFYGWAKTAMKGSGTPRWNFHKYLIGRNGHVIDYYGSMTSPDASSLTKAIASALAE